MSRFLRCFLIVCAAVLLLSAFYYGSALWMSGEARARALDAETGKPVADAIVLATWEVKGIEGYSFGPIAMFEVTSDAQGRFVIPGWGPRFHTGSGVVRGSEPVIRIFRRGYVPLVMHAGDTSPRPSHFMKPSIDGKDVKLEPAHMPLPDYTQVFGPYLQSIQFLYSSGRCEWRFAPRTTVEMHRLKHDLQGGGNAIEFRSVDEILDPAQCGSASDLLKVYLQ